VDRKLKAEKRVIGGTVAFARLQFQKALGVDVDRVGIRALAGNRNGDGFALDEQHLHARVNQASPELSEIQNAEHEREQPGKVEKNNTARETRDDEEVPGMTERPNEALGPQDPPSVHEEIGGADARARKCDDDATKTPHGFRSEPAVLLDILC